jgi:hypothetical protein
LKNLSPVEEAVVEESAPVEEAVVEESAPATENTDSEDVSENKENEKKTKILIKKNHSCYKNKFFIIFLIIWGKLNVYPFFYIIFEYHENNPKIRKSIYSS